MARILIAEDEPDIRALIEFTLTFGGHEVYSYSNGGDAVENALTLLPDLILLDVRMPRLTGYEACTVLKEDEKTKDIPIVFLSAKGQESEVNEGLALGAVAYILKPFAPDHLLNQLKKIMAEHVSGTAADKPKDDGTAPDEPEAATAPATPAAEKASTASPATEEKPDGSNPTVKPESPTAENKPDGDVPTVKPESPTPDKKPDGDVPTVKPESPVVDKEPDGDNPTARPEPPTAVSPSDPEKKPGENDTTSKPTES